MQHSASTRQQQIRFGAAAHRFGAGGCRQRPFKPRGSIPPTGKAEARSERVRVQIPKIVHIHRNSPDKPTVVFIPGLLGTSAEFMVHTTIQPRVARYANTVCFEPIDYSAPPSETSMREVVAQLRLWLDLRKMPGPYVLCGHSMGSVYSLKFASEFPSVTAGVVAIEGPGELGRVASHLRAGLRKNSSLLHEQHLERMLDEFEISPRLQLPTCPVIVHENLLPSFQEVRKYFDRYSIQDTRLNLAVVYAYFIYRHRTHVHLTSGHPASKLFTYFGRSHGLHQEEEDDIVRSLTTFLTDLKLTAAAAGPAAGPQEASSAAPSDFGRNRWGSSIEEAFRQVSRYLESCGR